MSHLTAVKSSSIKAIGYNEAEKRATIEFSSGGTYHYDGVDKKDYETLANADSIGKHFHAMFKGKYAGKKAQ